MKQIFQVLEEPQTPSSKIAYLNFINSIKSEESKYKYGYSLLKYLEFLKIEKEDLSHLLDQNIRTIEANIISYIVKLKKEDYSYSSINTKLSAITLFFTMNDITINRKKIGKYVGEHIRTVKDRAYTKVEIKKIVDASDLKYKVFVLLMASTGCRLGAIPHLRLRNIKYHQNENLYQITFYENTRSEYFSFCTPECSKYINEYLEYRKRGGEKLTPNTPLIRDDFIMDDLLHIENPKFISRYTYKFYLRNILIKTGIRKVSPTTESKEYKKNRTPIAQNHGFRKFTHTTMVNKRINPEIRELLHGHKIGLSGAYYRPSEKEILEEYLKVIDDLTINDENRLSKEIQELKEKNEDKDYVIKGKLQEKEQEINDLKRSMEFLTNRFNAFLISQPENKILYDDGNGQSGIAVKGIELNPQISHKAVGEVKINPSNNKKK